MSINNSNNDDNDVIITLDGVLTKHVCGHLIKQELDINEILSKYPERYKFLGEFFKILKGENNIIKFDHGIWFDRSWSLLKKEKEDLNVEEFKKVIEFYLEKSRFDEIVKDYVLFITLGEKFTPISSYDEKKKVYIPKLKKFFRFGFIILFEKPKDFEIRMDPDSIWGKKHPSLSERYQAAFNLRYELHDFVTVIMSKISENKLKQISFEETLKEFKDLSVRDVLIKYDGCYDSYSVALVKYFKNGEVIENGETLVKSIEWENEYWYNFILTLESLNFFDESFSKDFIGYGLHKYLVEDLKINFNLKIGL